MSGLLSSVSGPLSSVSGLLSSVSGLLSFVSGLLSSVKCWVHVLPTPEPIPIIPANPMNAAKTLSLARAHAYIAYALFNPHFPHFPHLSLRGVTFR